MIFAKYSNFNNDFLSTSIVKSLKHIGINTNFINLINNKQLLNSSNHSLKLIELKTLKTYIKINLASRFIISFKLFTYAQILYI